MYPLLNLFPDDLARGQLNVPNRGTAFTRRRWMELCEQGARELESMPRLIISEHWCRIAGIDPETESPDTLEARLLTLRTVEKRDQGTEDRGQDNSL